MWWVLAGALIAVAVCVAALFHGASVVARRRVSLFGETRDDRGDTWRHRDAA